ncbi:hypothetical protein KP509_01G039400 [Ceratopteris richardii]|uniref:Uncharacterized protein n=2 Tax=Ceratopteris richardii TaxID=49495 RepID=A0A8T2VCA1_CERRI|nr:hypothetical protein KP509_01G039400 [Ceratopteris richardii]KAH7446107.1 hypothetical protein KP509_01G039400 [Ceratopteris richardii]KAH7446108.1 hypothetical protein KP509_01G039400 [Ceratopteris richardii]
MGLIDLVRKAQREDSVQAPSVGLSGLKPIWLVSDDSSPSEKLVANGPITWKESPAVSDILKLREEQEERLTSELRAKVGGDCSLSFLDGLLRSYFEQLLDIDYTCSPNCTSDKKATCNMSFIKLLRRVSPHIGQKLLSHILRACLSCQDLDGVRAILEAQVVSGSLHHELVTSLIERDEVALLCTWSKNVSDPKFSDLLLVLKYFLKASLPAGKSLAQVRKQWRQAAISAIQRVSEILKSEENKGDISALAKHKNVKEEAIHKALLLSVAVDHFQPHELCLHYLLSSGQDEAVLAAILQQLDNEEVLKLLCYLNKWLDKYSSKSSLCTSQSKGKESFVPSLNDVIQWILILLDTHMMSLILCSDFHNEIQAIQLLVKGFVDFGHMIAPLAGIMEHLRSSSILPSHVSHGREDDPVIEYVEI